MKRILILALPLVLFTGFLTIKPPAIGADATPTVVTSPESIQSQTNSDQSPNVSKPPASTTKPSISGGNGDDDDDDEDDEDDEDDDDDDREKPRYGGHDDDDYDD